MDRKLSSDIVQANSLKRFIISLIGLERNEHSQDAALLHGEESSVQQVHKQRCQRIRELGSRKEHAITDHHADPGLAHRRERRTPCCSRYGSQSLPIMASIMVIKQSSKILRRISVIRNIHVLLMEWM